MLWTPQNNCTQLFVWLFSAVLNLKQIRHMWRFVKWVLWEITWHDNDGTDGPWLQAQWQSPVYKNERHTVYDKSPKKCRWKYQLYDSSKWSCYGKIYRSILGRFEELPRLDNGAIKAWQNNHLNKPQNMTCKMIRQENDRNIRHAPGASQNLQLY